MTASRLDLARRALAAAEASAGLRTRLAGPTAVGASGASPAPAGAVREATSAGPVGSGGAAGSEGASGTVRTADAGPVGAGVPGSFGAVDPERVLPVPAALAPLFPYGGLRRGSPVQVAGSTRLLLALAAAAGARGAWCAVVAMPDVGLAAADEAGLALDRVVVVPKPGPDAPAVLGALVDGFDVVVVGDCRALSDGDRRLLTSRVRTREAVLLSSAPWPGAELVLEGAHHSWLGVGRGHGLLREEELTITACGRGAAAARPVSVRVRLGAGGVAVSAAAGALRVVQEEGPGAGTQAPTGTAVRAGAVDGSADADGALFPVPDELARVG